MSSTNFQRMLQLAEDVFAVKNDPDQLEVNEATMLRLNQIHSACLTEQENEDGPIAWILVFPTSIELMNDFLGNKISERELFDRTPVGISYGAVYLCSALVLEEFRRKGIAYELTVSAIRRIQLEHPIEHLFVWAFTEEGNDAANKIALHVGLPLHKRLI